MPVCSVSAVGIGWLQGTVNGSVGDFAEAMQVAFGEWRPGAPNGFYEVGHRFGVHGAAIFERPRVVVAGREDELLVSVPQSALDAADKGVLRELVDLLLCAGYRPSRTDLYVDVIGVDRVTPERAYAAWCAGQAVTRSSSHDWHTSGRRATCRDATGQVVRPVVQGATFSLGSRTSASYLRIYDKAAEALSKRGELLEPTTRVELEGHRTREVNMALLLLEAWLLGDAEVGPRFLGLVLRTVDFRDCSAADKHKVRRARLPWWSSFVGLVVRSKVSRSVFVGTVQSRVRWVDLQVVPTLYGLREAFRRDNPHLPSSAWTAYVTRWVDGAGGRYRRGELPALVERVEAGADLFPSLVAA